MSTTKQPITGERALNALKIMTAIGYTIKERKVAYTTVKEYIEQLQTKAEIRDDAEI